MNKTSNKNLNKNLLLPLIPHFKRFHLRLILFGLTFLVLSRLSISQAFADRSELSLGMQFGLGEQLSNHALDTDVGAFVSRENQSWEQNEQFLQVGLGLSFRSTVLMKLGFVQSQAILQPNEAPVACLDAGYIQNTAGNRSTEDQSSLNQVPCIRSKAEVLSKTYHTALAYQYKPYDDLSPYLIFELGVSYLPSGEFWSNLERSEAKSSVSQSNNEQINMATSTTWTPLDLSSQRQQKAALSLHNRLSLGFEKRILSRWGVRLATWFAYGLSNVAQQEPILKYGLSFDVVYYRYIRLL